MAGFQIGTNTSTSMPAYPDFVQKPMENYYGALGSTGMLSGAGGWKSSVAPWNSNYDAAYKGAGGMLSGNTNYAPNILAAGSGYNPTMVTPDAIKQNMQPWLDQVGGGAMREIGRSYADARTAGDARDASAVAMGGSGGALRDAQMARNEAQDREKAMLGILGQGWNEGANLAGANAAASNTAGAQNAAQGLQAAIGADNGQSNFMQRGQGALSGLIQTGQLRQGYDQQNADLPYTDLNRFLQLLQGAPSGQTDSTPVTFDPVALALGLAGLKF